MAVKTNAKIIFSESSAQNTSRENGVWKILIVDDESIMHSVTKLVLRDFQFEGRNLEFLSAYSDDEARTIIRETPDICVSLIDIVMEQDNSGLELVRWIREEYEDHEMRIILRTGQPGLAPERDIIQRYEINDYKEKTELTDIKLITAMTVAIRGYRDLHVLNRNRHGFEQILKGAGDFYQSEDLRSFISLMGQQFNAIVFSQGSAEAPDSLIAQRTEGRYKVIWGSGRFENGKGSFVMDLDAPDAVSILDQCNREHELIFHSPYMACLLKTRQTEDTILFTRLENEPDETDKVILSAFMINAALAMDNWLLSLNRSKSQKNMLYFLSEVIEQHFSETGNHIRRVSEMVYTLSLEMGVDDNQAENWKMASILHDIGKIGIPDKILKKPGKLTDNEMEIMKTHVSIGYKMLSSNEDAFFPDAADIAMYHHECWNGSGYPKGLEKEEIPFPARMLAVVDVFDALTHKRIYKGAWTVDEALGLLQDKKGIDFEPAVVDKFIAHIDQMKRILDAYPD